MDTLVAAVIAKWGILGIVFFFACYIIYDNLKNSKNDRVSSANITMNKNNIEMLANLLKGKLDVIGDNVEMVMKNSELMNDKFDAEIVRLDKKIDKQCGQLADELENRAEQRLHNHHRFMAEQIKIGPKVHVVMGKYLSRIKCDHIVLGSFHNGNSSITGIPYYKYDIVAEKFSPDKIERDVEFAYMYKDVDILRHDKLPITLMQAGLVHYEISPDGTSELSEIDDIIYRRMLGRDIKQISLHILRQTKSDGESIEGKPIGFIGCIKYNYDPMDKDELDLCAHEIENIYNNLK